MFLGYSLTANKIKSDTAHLSEIKMKKAHPQVELEGDEDDINFSELGSVKDNESLSEWDPADLEHSRS